MSGQLGRSGNQIVTPRRTANVDETLFGTTPRKTGNRKVGQEIMITGKDTVRVRKTMGYLDSPGAGAAARDIPVIIPASELNRLRDSATLLSRAEQEESKRRAEEAYNERMKKSKERKEKMLQMEEERRKNARLADIDSEGRAQKNSVLEKAKQMIDEDMDDVKHMNQMMLYSKIVTIRDAQIQEKRAVQAEREEEERQLDMMMEIERLKALQVYEEREKTRVEDQRRGASMIVHQIKERQAQRMREEEARDQERAFVLKQIEVLKAEEVEQQKEKKLAAARLMVEVNAANTNAAKIKEERILAEKLEQQKILEYQENKERRERELEEDKARSAADKELETAKLRARQEKAQDKASEMDALRAKRAAEKAERLARDKEKQERDRLSNINAELTEARNQQQAEKEKRLGEQAKYERDEFERIMEVQMQQEEAERQRRANEKETLKQHAMELRAQINAREEKALQARRDFLEEGNTVRSSIGGERRKLEKIKARKIDEMKRTGVPEKYWAELERKKISV